MCNTQNVGTCWSTYEKCLPKDSFSFECPYGTKVSQNLNLDVSKIQNIWIFRTHFCGTWGTNGSKFTLGPQHTNFYHTTYNIISGYVSVFLLFSTVLYKRLRQLMICLNFLHVLRKMHESSISSVNI